MAASCRCQCGVCRDLPVMVALAQWEKKRAMRKPRAVADTFRAGVMRQKTRIVSRVLGVRRPHLVTWGPLVVRTPPPRRSVGLSSPGRFRYAPAALVNAALPPCVGQA